MTTGFEQRIRDVLSKSSRTGSAEAHQDRRPVVLASSGSAGATSAAHVARQIAKSQGVQLHVVSAIEPVVIYAGSNGLAPMAVVDPNIDAEREQVVRAQVDGAMKDGAMQDGLAYDLELRYGPVASELAAVSSENEAGMVVIGAAPRRRGDRITSGVRAAQVLRKVRCPVLSVAPGITWPPRKAVAAIDFGRASIRAAREALRLLDPSGTLTLIYVEPVPQSLQTPPGVTSGLPAETAAATLDRIHDSLQRMAAPGVIVNTMVRTGDVVDAILETVNATGVELVAVGTNGPGTFERMVVGSIASELLHLSPCHVLASPPPDEAGAVTQDLESWGTAQSLNVEAWAATLETFSKRNGGRLARIEEDGSEIGAQVQVNGYEFAGAAYDHKDQRIDIMLNAPGKSGSHITRIIPEVRDIAITRDSLGKDFAMRIHHDGGDTLVIFDDQSRRS